MNIKLCCSLRIYYSTLDDDFICIIWRNLFQLLFFTLFFLFISDEMHEIYLVSCLMGNGNVPPWFSAFLFYFHRNTRWESLFLWFVIIILDTNVSVYIRNMFLMIIIMAIIAILKKKTHWYCVQIDSLYTWGCRSATCYLSFNHFGILRARSCLIFDPAIRMMAQYKHRVRVELTIGNWFGRTNKTPSEWIWTFILWASVFIH